MLRLRLPIAVVAVLVLALGAFGLLADRLFERSQRAQLDALLTRELERVQRLVADGQVGARFVRDDGPDLRIQFVDGEGAVQLPPGGAEALPLVAQPTLHAPEARLVASVPWHLPSGREVGTVRAALDVSGFLAARADLRRSLLLAGAVLVVAGGVLVFLWVRRALRPLGVLARRAAAVDPARPDAAPSLAPDPARHDEIAHVARALQSALDAVRARQQAERDALAEVAHELSAPLTVVAGRLRALEAAHGADPGLRSARRAADELLHTSQDLLTLARGELGRELELRAVDVGALARELAEEVGDVRVEAQGPVEALGDPERLRQALRNLLRNAQQAGGPEATVVLRVHAEAEWAVLEVADRGPGLPEGPPHRVFERHVSGRRGGNGLGLSVAREIALRHEGSVTAAPRPGGGARFVLRVPRLQESVEDTVADEFEPGRRSVLG